jgi:hypothetical protein
MIRAMVTTETKPVWNSSSFLIYQGGLTVLSGAVFALTYLSVQFPGTGQGTAWALLIFVILAAVALGFRRANEWLAAGIFAFTSVFAWGILVVVDLKWWGWENGTFHDFRAWSWSRLLLEVLVLLAAAGARWHFKFPFIRLISAAVGALFVFDVLTKGHGNPLAIVSLLLGLAYLAFGTISDKPSTFWLHLAAGFLVGIPILYWCHETTFDFAVIAFMSLVYVTWAYKTRRSSWAVFGTIGFIITTTYFVAKAVQDTIQSSSSFGGSPLHGLWFVPLAIGLLGFWLVLLGMAGKLKKGDKREPITTETKPVWNSSSFLIYAGGLTVLIGAAVGLIYLGIQDRGDGARSGWTLLFLVIIYGLAHALRLRGRWLAAGIFAFVSVLVWAALVILTMRWIGWHPLAITIGFGQPANPLATWSWSRMLFWILVLGAAFFDRWMFKFPFIRLISAVVGWLFVADLLTSFHGNWFAVVTLFTGLAYLVAGHFVDKPSTFWLHLIGGALIGGTLLYWFHDSDGDFALISIFALLYVLVAFWTKRSSWAVYGAIGFGIATDWYLGLPAHSGPASLLLGASQQCSSSVEGLGPVLTTCTPMGSVSPWAPALAYGLLGFWLVGLGLLGMRMRTHKPAAVAVEKTVVLETPPPPPPPPVAEPPAAEPPVVEPPAEEPPAE